MKTDTKFIVLDIGNVLCKVNMIDFVDELSTTVNIPILEAQHFLKRCQKMHDLGYTTIEDELREKFDIKSETTILKLKRIWNDSVTPCEPILEFFATLKQKHNLKIALLSNIGLEHAALMDKKLSHYRFIDNTIKHFSCEIGARKPSIIYYQSFLFAYPEFQGCLYIDDLQENLDAGAKFDFKPFKFDLDYHSNNGTMYNKVSEINKLIINA
jgi:FMN phosphatase YigB (HAD superfamily)